MTVRTMRTMLTASDITVLVHGADAEERALAAHKVCRKIDGDDLSEAERVQAAEILRVLANDAAELVRRALAVTLRASTKLPHDVAIKLACDIETVALPVLAQSPMLTDADLVAIVRTSSPRKQTAVAARPTLSLTVSRAIVETGEAAPVRRALENPGAAFDGRLLGEVLVRFPGDEAMAQAMVYRPSLPIHIAEKLVNAVSGTAFDHLVNHHALPPQLAIDLASGARERASIDLVSQAGRSPDLRRFVQQLALNGRLTPSFVLRALCLGHMAFVEQSLAEMSGLALKKAWKLLHDTGPLGLKALYERANMPAGMFAVFKSGVELYHQLEAEGRWDREFFSQLMTARALTQARTLPREDAEYLLEKLDVLSEAVRAERARHIADRDRVHVA